MKFFRTLFGQVVIALLLGIAVGLLLPEFAQKLKPLGDGFINLIRMLIAPLIFLVVVHGISGAGDLKKVGRVGIKAIVYFEIVTTFALALGVLLAYVFKPGVGMNVDPAALDASSLANYTDRAQAVQSGGAVEFIQNLIPTTFFSAFTDGNTLQVLLLAILFGVALTMLGKVGQPLVQGIDQLAQVFFRIIGMIVRLAPIGVFGAVAFTVGKYGVQSLANLGYLVALFYVTCIIFVIGVLGLILRSVGFSIFKLLRYLREELLIVAGTTSSDSVLPQIMRKLEHMGIKNSTVGLVIPTGYSFNLDGFSIYLTLAAVFIAQATNTPLSLGTLLTILLVSLLTSKGAHGIPGSAIVILAATLTAVPAIPIIGLVLVLAVDWFMGIARALTNMIGNCVATVVIGAWEKDIDKERAHRVLNGEETTEEVFREEELEHQVPVLPKATPT